MDIIGQLTSEIEALKNVIDELEEENRSAMEYLLLCAYNWGLCDRILRYSERGNWQPFASTLMYASKNYKRQMIKAGAFEDEEHTVLKGELCSAYNLGLQGGSWPD